MTHTKGNEALLPIILIDDDTDDLEIMTQELAEMQFNNELFTFNLPAEALEFMETIARHPYLISCDVHMPKMDAYDFRSLMLDKFSHLSHIPFYVLSSVITDREILYSDSLQISGYYIKGFTKAMMQQNFRDMFAASEKKC